MNQWLAAIVTGIIQAIVAIVKMRLGPTAEDGARRPALRERLRDRVRRTWSGKAPPVIAFLIVLLAMPGCGARTIYVPSGEPVRLREPVRSAKVWVLDESGKAVAGVMDLPEGWYCLPVSQEGED